MTLLSADAFTPFSYQLTPQTYASLNAFRWYDIITIRRSSDMLCRDLGHNHYQVLRSKIFGFRQPNTTTPSHNTLCASPPQIVISTLVRKNTKLRYWIWVVRKDARLHHIVGHVCNDEELRYPVVTPPTTVHYAATLAFQPLRERAILTLSLCYSYDQRK